MESGRKRIAAGMIEKENSIPNPKVRTRAFPQQSGNDVLSRDTSLTNISPVPKVTK